MRRDAVRRSHAPRVHRRPGRWVRHQASEVSPWWCHLFACPFCVNCAFFLFDPFFSRTLYICWLVCLGRKVAEELLRKMKERREAKDREEAEKRKESDMCLSHPLCRAMTMAHYGPIYL